MICTLVCIESLLSPKGGLTPDKERHLIAEAMRCNKDYRENPSPMNDEFIGAMRLRYAYSLTAHKAQGGEWDTVIVHPYRARLNLKWDYTAITRARENIYSWAS
jgi:exodeoxyribonuclease-5